MIVTGSLFFFCSPSSIISVSNVCNVCHALSNPLSWAYMLCHFRGILKRPPQEVSVLSGHPPYEVYKLWPQRERVRFGEVRLPTWRKDARRTCNCTDRGPSNSSSYRIILLECFERRATTSGTSIQKGEIWVTTGTQKWWMSHRVSPSWISAITHINIGFSRSKLRPITS
jgi:hypothetical protein